MKKTATNGWLITTVQDQTIEHDTFSASGHLEDAEACLKNYNLHVVSLMFQKYDFNGGNSVLEFGAGLGTLADIVRNRYDFSPVCVEIDSSFLKLLRDKGFVSFQSINEIQDEKFDFVYSSNVLEHIKDDVAILKELRKIMAPSATLALYIPALKFLYSEHDRNIGHFRRYSRKELRDKLDQAGFRVDHIRYSDSAGILPWFLLRFKTSTSSKQSNEQRLLRVYDRILFPISRLLDSLGFKWVLGKNILVFASLKVPTSNSDDLN
jgi:SAM-dependent methyltransferase